MSKPLAAPPDVIRWVSRSGDHDDCAVAAIAMACGATYEVALQACFAVAPKVLNGGMRWGEIRRAVIALGWVTRTLPFEKLNLEEGTGILELEPIQDDKVNHVVYLWEGHVIEPKFDRQELWDDANMFCSHYGYRIGRLLTLKRED